MTAETIERKPFRIPRANGGFIDVNDPEQVAAEGSRYRAMLAADKDYEERETARIAAMTAIERVKAMPLTQIDRSAPEPLLHGRISPTGHTILFGPGDAGKGVLTSSWIARHVEAGERVFILDFEDHPEEWARRIYGIIKDVRLLEEDPIMHVSPLRHGAPDWDLLAQAADEHEASLIVIDSVAYAIPGKDPSDPEAATAYSANIQRFAVPVLSLAHVNRQGDERYPFGSVFWHAGARATWSLKPEGTDGAKLVNRKHNNYEWQGAYMVTSEWSDSIPRNVHERPYSITVNERITDILRAGPADLDEIEAALKEDESGEPIKRPTLRKALARGLTTSPKAWTVEDERWRLIEGDA